MEFTKLLPDTTDFRELIDNNCIYVDKTAEIEISENVDIDESDSRSSHDISDNNKIALNHFIDTLALSSTTASDSQGKDDSSQYDGNYSKLQIKFIFCGMIL
jgi:hypothetical protein